MKNKSESTPFNDEEFADHLVKVGVFVIVAACLALLIYLFWFHGHKLSNDPGDWGAFGDYIGGLINPVVGLATVVLVIYSINIQRRELRATVEEMKTANVATARISFEQSMFAWLGNYHTLLASISIDGQHGRQALESLYNANLAPAKTIRVLDLPPHIEQIALRNPNEAYIVIDVPGPTGLRQVGECFFRAVIAYQRIFFEHRSNLDASVRTLYRLIQWIDQSPLTVQEKWHYSALIRDQLSWMEVVFLFYNGLILQGEDFAPLANKYALFDALVEGDFRFLFAKTKITPTPPNEHPRLRDGYRAWPYTPTAFDSVLAKAALGLTESRLG